MEINKSRLFKIAHAMVRKAEVFSFSEALKKAWKVMKLYAQLLLGNVHFTYRKTTGEIREAYGTLKIESQGAKPTGKKRVRPADQICYMDLDKKSWRSFNAAYLI